MHRDIATPRQDYRSGPPLTTNSHTPRDREEKVEQRRYRAGIRVEYHMNGTAPRLSDGPGGGAPSPCSEGYFTSDR